MKDSFDMIGLEELSTIVPPSYLKDFAEKYPASYLWLIRKINGDKWPWKTIGDYYIITLR